MAPQFLLNLLIKVTIVYAVHYINGLLVYHKNVKVNYTRKINHFILYFLPFFLDKILVYKEDEYTFISGCIVTAIILFLFIKPIRNKSNFIKIGFMSFDRPEDRPHTLFWLSTQYFFGWLVLVPLSLYLSSIDVSVLIFIPVLITGLGDGLAEPIGIRFGKHKYKVYALFSKKKYERSLEGSACVFIASLIIVSCYKSYFTDLQFVLALLFIPILMTLTEAFSPHTWDSPLLFLTGGASVIGILQI